MRYLLILTFIFLATFSNAQSSYEMNRKGDFYWEKGDYETAISFYSKAINLKKEPLYYYNRGYSKENLGRYDAAIADYTQAIKLNNRYADAYNNRGFCYDNLGEYEKAIADYSAAIKAKPGFVDAYNNRGFAKRQLDQFEAAVADYTKALKLDGTFEVAYNNRGSARNELGEYELAVKDFDKAIALNNKDANTYNNRGTAYFYLREYEAAITDYNKALTLRPNFKEAYFHRGSAKYYLEQDEAALKDINKALEIDPYFDFALKRKEMIINSIESRKRLEADGVFLEKEMKDDKVKIIPPKKVDKLTLNWGETKLINNTITKQNSIKIQVETSQEELDIDKFILFINGDSINSAKNREFKNQVFSAEVPLRVGANDIYVIYESSNTTFLRVDFRPERNILYTMIVGADLTAKTFNYQNAVNFNSLFDKQFLLYKERSDVKLEQDKTTSKKVEQGINSIKVKEKNQLSRTRKNTLITYISTLAYVSDDEKLLLTAMDFNPKKLEKSTFSVADIMDKVYALDCRKILFLDIQLDKDYDEIELEMIKMKLQKKAKTDGFTLFASVQNQSNFKVSEIEKSIFTNLLIEGLSGKADENQDKVISTEELKNYLESQKMENFVIEVKSNFSLVTIE